MTPLRAYNTHDTYLYDRENLIVQQLFITQGDPGAARILYDFSIIVFNEGLEKEGCDFQSCCLSEGRHVCGGDN